jgi:DNA-binding NarL/FixJ family response regulator
VDQIKVLLASNPPELQATLRELFQDQIDIQLVGEDLDPIRVLLAVGDHQADAVVVTIPFVGQDIGICSHLLAEYPDLTVLAFQSDGRAVYLLRRGIVREKLRKTSGEAILAAIREIRS